MPLSFKQRFLIEAGDHPYAWAKSLGLPKDLVTAVLRGADDYQPIQRTLNRLADATARSVEWWLTGEDGAVPDTDQSGQTGAKTTEGTPAMGKVVGTIAAGSSQVDLEKLEIAIQAFTEWEAERGVKVSGERRSAAIAVIYGHLQNTDSADAKDAIALVLRALG